ncbi:hypothetical protein FRC06_007778, partial [Ceratobasidium sp. 370]
VSYLIAHPDDSSKAGHIQVIHGHINTTPDHRITLNDNECISAASSYSGFADNETGMDDCVQTLSLEITDSSSGRKRAMGPFGTAHNLNPEGA